MGVICIRGRRLRLWISNKDKLSVACDTVVMTGILFKDKIRSRIGMSGLKKVGSSLCRDEATEERSIVDDNGVRCDEATEKESTVDNDGVECVGARENALIVDDNGVGCDDAIEKESTVDNNDIGSIGLGRSGLGGIGSSLRREGHPRCR